MPRHLDFYFFVGNTCSHLSVNRTTALAAALGVTLNWRPFSVRTLMREQNNSPFVGKPVKMAYMWRDLARRARRFGSPFDGAQPYPIDPQERANHVATLVATEGWCEPFVRDAYRTWFMDKLDPGTPDALASIVARLGQPADSIERAEQPDVAAHTPHKPMPRASWDASAHPASCTPEGKCSGATTGWKTPSSGLASTLAPEAGFPLAQSPGLPLAGRRPSPYNGEATPPIATTWRYVWPPMSIRRTSTSTLPPP